MKNPTQNGNHNLHPGASQCALPPPLEDWQLLASLDDAADARISAHLARCADCRDRRDQLEGESRALNDRLYRATCPPNLVIGEYHLGMLMRERSDEVGAHIARCPHCAAELAALRRHLRVVEPDIEWSTSEKLQSLIGRVLDASRGLTRPGIILAPAMSGLRGVATGPLLIEADGLLLTLEFEDVGEGRARVQGQLAADEQDRWTGAVVELRQAGYPPETSIVDNLGAFQCHAQLAVPLDLRITPSGGPDFQAFGVTLPPPAG